MQELEGTRRRHDGINRAAHRLGSSHTEDGPEPLSPGEDTVTESPDNLLRKHVFPGEVLLECFLDYFLPPGEIGGK